MLVRGVKKMDTSFVLKQEFTFCVISSVSFLKAKISISAVL